MHSGCAQELNFTPWAVAGVDGGRLRRRARADVVCYARFAEPRDDVVEHGANVAPFALAVLFGAGALATFV
jgi:hypothetical protein